MAVRAYCLHGDNTIIFYQLYLISENHKPVIQKSYLIVIILQLQKMGLLVICNKEYRFSSLYPSLIISHHALVFLLCKTWCIFQFIQKVGCIRHTNTYNRWDAVDQGGCLLATSLTHLSARGAGEAYEEALGICTAPRVKTQSNLVQHFNHEKRSRESLGFRSVCQYSLCFTIEYNSTWPQSLKPEILLMMAFCHLNFQNTVLEYYLFFNYCVLGKVLLSSASEIRNTQFQLSFTSASDLALCECGDVSVLSGLVMSKGNYAQACSVGH